MSVSNNIISMKDVSINDPKQVLGSDSNDIQSICLSNNVNLYSRYKPVSGDVNTDTGLQRASIPISSTNIPIDALNPTATKWVRKSVSAPYKLGDFAGYNHNAANPLTTIPSSTGSTVNFKPRMNYLPKVTINQDDCWFFFGSRTKKKMIPIIVLAFRDNNTGASSVTQYCWSCAPINKVPTENGNLSYYNGFDLETREVFRNLLPRNTNGEYRWLMSMITIDDATRLIGLGKLREEIMLPVGTSFNGLLLDNDYLYFNDTTSTQSLNTTEKIRNPDECVIELAFLYPRRFAFGSYHEIKYEIFRTGYTTVVDSGTFIMNSNIPYDGTLWRSNIVIPMPSQIIGQSSFWVRFTYTRNSQSEVLDPFTTTWSDNGTVKKTWTTMTMNSTSQYCELTFPTGKKSVIRNT